MADSTGFTIGPAEDSSTGFTIGPAEDAPSGFSLDEGKAPSDTYILNLVGDPFYIPTYEEYLAYDKARNRESVPFIKTVGEAAEMAWNDITGFFTGLVNLGAEGEVGQMAAALGEGAARGTADLGQLVRKGIYDNIQYAIGDDADDYKTFLATRELDAMRERARRGDESLMFELIPEANKVAEGFSYVADPSVFVPGLGIGSKAVTKGASAATRGAGKAIAGTGRLLQRPADAIASRVGDLAATAEAATMRRPGLGMSTVQTAGGVGRALETMGELFKEAGKQMEKAPSRVGLLRSIEYSADAAENIRKLAGRGARVLDPGLSAIGKLGEGVITGATVGGVLGGIAEGERGLYSGMGAGGLLGGTASTIAGVGGKVTGLANRSKRRNDYNNWLKQFDPESRKRIEHYVGDNLNNAAEVMGIDDLGVGIMGKDTVIEYLTEAEARAAKAEWHERETGEKIDPDAIPDFRGVEFLDSTTEGQIPRILINVEHKSKPGHTLAHEVFHSLNKLDGMQDYISRLNSAILGKELMDGTPLEGGLFTPDQFADLADQYASRFLKKAPRRGKKAKKGVTIKDKEGKFTKESVDVYNKFKNDKVRILEEIGAEFFAALLSGKPDYLVPGKGMDSLSRQAMDSLLLADANSRLGRIQNILDASFGKIFKWDKITGESDLFSINGKPITGNPMLNALMRDMIRAKRAIRDRMEVAPGKRREVEIKPLNTPQEGLKKFINRHKDHPITNLFETDKKGRIKPKKIADTHQEEVELSNKIADAIESVADDGDPKTMRTSTDEKGNPIFKGQRFSPKQMEAIKNTPGINNKVLEYLEMLNELIGEGRQIDLEYYAATRLDRQGRRRYSSGIKQSRRLVVPYSIEVSRAGNFFVRALDASKLGDKIDGWKKSRKEWIRNWTNMDELYSDLARYLQNLASPAPEPSAKLFGEKKRNILNELMGARGRAGFNPLALEKMAEKDFLVRSFRVDRVTEMNLDAGLPGLKGEKIPYGEQSYALQKENYMPETDDVPRRISTRYPTGVNRMEDPLSAVLLINSESIFKLPQDKQEIVAETISKYVNLKIPKAKQKDLKYVSEQLKQQSVDNLLWLFDQVPEEVRKRSKLWYDGARKLSEEWSGKYKVSTATVAGVLASLSPQKDWFMNVSLAERVLDIYKNKAKGPMTPEMIQKARSMTDLKGDLPKVIIEQLDKMAGKNFKQLTTLQKAIYTRIYDEVHNSRSYGVFSPEGKNLGMKTKKDGEESKVAWGSYKQIENAVRAIEDPSYESLSALTGDQHKVRNFYNNILLPNKALEDVTIDTHAVAAALLRPLAGSDTEVTHNLGGGVPASSITGAKGTYGFFADAYREAARQRGMKPREMQSITWEAVRGLFPAEWKQNKKNKVLVDSLWKRYSGGRTKIDVIRKEILKSAGGINNPEWFGFDSRGAKGGGSRGDTKKLAGPSVSRGAAKTGGYGGRGYPGDPRVPTTGKIPVFLEEKTQPKEIRFAFMPADQDYLAAVDKGDTGAAQAMVDQAAKKAGYKGPWYHGSDGSFSSFKAGSMFTKDSSYAKDHGSTVKRFYLRGVDNPIPLSLGEFQGLGGAKGISRLSGTYQLGDSLIVNDPSQVKSAEPVTRDDDGNVIPLSERFNPGEDDFNYMPATDEMGFYSRVAEVAESNKISKGPGDQIFATIKKQPGVRDDEIKWLGLEEFLKGKKQVTKEELTDFIRENNLQMEETVLDTDSGDLGKKIPVEEIRLVQRKDPIGGKETWYRESSDGSYREEVTQPIDRWLEEGVIKSVEDYDQWWIDNSKEQGEDFVTVDEYTETSTGDRTKYESETLAGAEPGSYTEVLLKMPVSDRKMTLEEMIELPDYNQFIVDYFNGNDSPARQKKIHKSYLAGEPFKTRDYGLVDLNFNSRDEPNYKSSHWDEPNVLAHIRFNVRKGPNGERILFIEELQSDWHREGRDGGYGGAIPDAPFKTSWHELALKRVLRFAAEGNFDKLAWINGEETAKRYDLSKKVSEVVYDEATQSLNAYSKTGIVFMEKGVPPEKIAEYIGKEPAERLLNQPYDHPPAEMSYEQDKYGGFGYVKKPGSKTSKRLKGEELKVGGEWAHNLYDKMVPQFLKRYGKKWGSRVSKVAIGTVHETNLINPNFDSINITAEMKESVEAGQAMYMPATATDAVAKQVGERPKLGVNINSGKIPFGDMIIKGLKTIETRRDLSRNGLRRPSKTGETIALVSTFGGGKQAEIIGTAKVGEPVEYNTLKEFRADYKKHRVDPGSEYDWDGYKVGYPLKEVKPLSKPVPVPKGTPGSPMHKNLDGVNYMPAGHAKAGGEVGVNKDFYKGGQFLPSTEMPKRDRAKIAKQASQTEQFEVGSGQDKKAIPEPYQAPLLRWYSTFMNDAHMDYLTREGTPMEYIKSMEDFRKRFESGERWIDIREYPEFAQPNDLARLFKAGLPIPEASFDKLDHLSAVKSMRKHSKKATGDEANLMPATEADSRIPSRVPPKPVVSNRSPMLQWLAQSFIEKGLIDKEDWDTAVNALSPVDAKRSQIPDAYKVNQVNQNYPMVLDSVKQEKFVDVLQGEGPKEGTSVGLRIDIKAFENSLAKVASGELDFPIYVVTIHSEGSKNIGKDKLGYSAIGAVSDPTFLIGSEKGSLGIAAGKRKTTLATVEGEWVPLSEVPNVTGEGWTMVGMDPTRHSYFYDKESGQPIKGGSLAISFGNTVFVRDAIPMTPEEASGVLYMPAKEVGGSTVYKGEEGARVIKTKSGKYRVYGANKALLGIASSQKMADRILQRGTKKVSIRKRPSRGLAGVGGS